MPADGVSWGGRNGVSAATALGQNGVLRFTTCGAVDDGKSTLLGRLLLDANAVFHDQLAALIKASKSHHPGADDVDPSLLFDGLAVEREQSITVDVAYRYFMTSKRKFIVADAPGHEAHTRNMATAASNADVAVLVVDATRGPSEQTRRHARIAALVGVQAAIIAINKMDAVGFDSSVFEARSEEVRAICAEVGLTVACAIPVAARDGANVVGRYLEMAWWTGPTLLEALESVDLGARQKTTPFRFSVQSVAKPQAALGGRGYLGTVSSGEVAVGDDILIVHWGTVARVRRIVTANGDLDRASAGAAITLVLDGEFDIARGDLLSSVTQSATMTSRFTAELVCFAPQGLEVGARYEFRCAAKSATATIVALSSRNGDAEGNRLDMNAVERCVIELTRPVALDRFTDSRDTGAFLLVDRFGGDTMAAGVVRDVTESLLRSSSTKVTQADRVRLSGHRPTAIWFTGLPSAGKTTIANLVEQRLNALGVNTYGLDGDALRTGLMKDLGFSREDRKENIRRAAEVARLFVDAGLVLTCAFVSPLESDRDLARDLIGADAFIEVFVNASVEACIARDVKGFYKRALSGEIADFTGVSSQYEPPRSADLTLDTVALKPDALADQVIALLRRRGVLDPAPSMARMRNR